MYKKTYYELTMSYVYLHTCLAILQTITWCKAYQNLVLNGTGPLKLLHLYGNLAIVMTTSNKLVAEPCNYNIHVHTYMYVRMNLSHNVHSTSFPWLEYIHVTVHSATPRKWHRHFGMYMYNWRMVV